MSALRSLKPEAISKPLFPVDIDSLNSILISLQGLYSLFENINTFNLSNSDNTILFSSFDFSPFSAYYNIISFVVDTHMKWHPPDTEI